MNKQKRRMLTRITGYLAKFVFLLGSLLPFIAQAEKEKSFKVTLPLNNWVSQRVITQAVGQLIAEQGYDVDYHHVSSTDQWGALKRGLIHFQLEVWQASMESYFNTLVADNYILDVKTHSAKGREDWWYPSYVENYCADLPSWQALNNCSLLFAENSHQSKGAFLSGPWQYKDAELIRALGLNFKIKRFDNQRALWQHLELSESLNKPIVMLNWSPNWTDIHLSGTFIDFPAYEEKCVTDPKWGLNSQMNHDCGNPKQGWIKTAAWSGLPKAAPCLYEFIGKIDLSHFMIAKASALVIVDKMPEKEAATHWLNLFKSSTKGWLKPFAQCPA